MNIHVKTDGLKRTCITYSSVRSNIFRREREERTEREILGILILRKKEEKMS